VFPPSKQPWGTSLDSCFGPAPGHFRCRSCSKCQTGLYTKYSGAKQGARRGAGSRGGSAQGSVSYPSLRLPVARPDEKGKAETSTIEFCWNGSAPDLRGGTRKQRQCHRLRDRPGRSVAWFPKQASHLGCFCTGAPCLLIPLHFYAYVTTGTSPSCSCAGFQHEREERTPRTRRKVSPSSNPREGTFCFTEARQGYTTYLWWMVVNYCAVPRVLP